MGASCCKDKFKKRAAIKKLFQGTLSTEPPSNKEYLNMEDKEPNTKNRRRQRFSSFQEDNKEKYSKLGSLQRRETYSRQSLPSGPLDNALRSSSHLLHLVSELNRNVIQEQDNNNFEYINWELLKKPSGEIYWINKGKVSFTKEEIDKITHISDNCLRNLSFLIKRVWAAWYLKSIISDNVVDNPYIIVSRNNILEDSLNQFKTVKELNLKRAIHVYFIDEKANDVGGIYREWFSCILREFFSEKRGLFVINQDSGLGKHTILINNNAEDNQKNLEFYEFFGKLIAKALIDRTIFNENLNYVIIKQLLKRKINWDDIKYIDIELYSSLYQLSKTVIKEPDLNLPFVWNIRDKKTKELIRIELIKNGANIPITEETKFLFLEKVAELITYKNLQNKVDAICRGFDSLIPTEKINIFTIEEFDFLLSGQNEIDLNDWQENTEYRGGYNEQSDTIKFFWEVLKELPPEQLHTFFTFCTGSARAPINGFQGLQSSRNQIVKFCIEKKDYQKDKYCLISAQTCFNRIYLPDFKDKTILKNNILTIITNDTNYFGIE